MAKWPGLPERLRDALKQAGYWKNDRADVIRFSLEHRFVPTYVYKWIGGTAVPDRSNLYRLGDTLKISPGWLLFGEDNGKPETAPKRKRRIPHPIAGGASDPGTLPAVQVPEDMLLIRHWLRLALDWLARPMLPSMLSAAGDG